jgi:hypothetical protein
MKKPGKLHFVLAHLSSKMQQTAKIRDLNFLLGTTKYQ